MVNSSTETVLESSESVSRDKDTFINVFELFDLERLNVPSSQMPILKWLDGIQPYVSSSFKREFQSAKFGRIILKNLNVVGWSFCSLAVFALSLNLLSYVP